MRSRSISDSSLEVSLVVYAPVATFSQGDAKRLGIDVSEGVADSHAVFARPSVLNLVDTERRAAADTAGHVALVTQVGAEGGYLPVALGAVIRDARVDQADVVLEQRGGVRDVVVELAAPRIVGAQRQSA